MLLFGGIVNQKQIAELLSIPQVAGVLIGNSLNYREHSIKILKESLNSQPIRIHKQKDN